MTVPRSVVLLVLRRNGRDRRRLAARSRHGPPAVPSPRLTALHPAQRSAPSTPPRPNWSDGANGQPFRSPGQQPCPRRTAWSSRGPRTPQAHPGQPRQTPKAPLQRHDSVASAIPHTSEMQQHSRSDKRALQQSQHVRPQLQNHLDGSHETSAARPFALRGSRLEQDAPANSRDLREVLAPRFSNSQVSNPTACFTAGDLFATT